MKRLAAKTAAVAPVSPPAASGDEDIAATAHAPATLITAAAHPEFPALSQRGPGSADLFGRSAAFGLMAEAKPRTRKARVRGTQFVASCLRGESLVLGLGLVLLFAAGAAAQHVATGFPPFGSFSGGQFDTVNNANLNVHFTIPAVSKAGRGLPFYYLMGYDSSLWLPTYANGQEVWAPAANWGWEGITGAWSGYATYDWQQGSCPVAGGFAYYDIYTNWTYSDASATQHYFSNVTTSDADLYAPQCADAPPGQASATDSAGYTLQAGEGDATVITPSGLAYVPPTAQANPPGPSTRIASVTDPNLNEVSATDNSGTTTFTDTLGIHCSHGIRDKSCDLHVSHHFRLGNRHVEL